MSVSIKTRQAYSEIDEFLGLLSEEQRNEIPKKLRELFKEEKDKEYFKNIDTNIPIKDQNLKEETLAIIALFNLQYWCKDEEDRKLTINMLSPLKMAQVRCVTLIGSYSVKNAINRVLQPLIDDGYNIEEFNVGNEEITLNFVLEPIEYCMNAIGHKSRIYWFIDEKKNIYVD